MTLSTDGPVAQCAQHGDYSLHTGCFGCHASADRGRLIVLCSPAMGSGKSTVAAHLVKHHGFIKEAFATPLKKMTEGLFTALGMPASEIEDRVYGSRKEEVVPGIGVSSRRIQQTIGTEWGRHCIGESLWTDITMSLCNTIRAAGINVVIDDMRFPNELAAVQAAGGECWRIQRPGVAVTAQHASEGALDHVAMRTLDNGLTIKDLRAVIDEALVAS